jgi:hypothetical protein
MKWEILIEGVEETARLKIDGGWLYRHGYWNEEAGHYTNFQVCFVPEKLSIARRIGAFFCKIYHDNTIECVRCGTRTTSLIAICDGCSVGNLLDIKD